MRPVVRGLVVVLVLLSACKKESKPEQQSGDRPGVAVPTKSVTLRIAYSSEKKAWMEEAIKAFLADRPKTPGGAAIQIEAKSYGSGEAATAILDGSWTFPAAQPA